MGTGRIFRGKTIVITGGAGGLGRAFGHRFAQAGARVALLDLNGKGVEEQAALPSLMERDGLIIVISSVAGFAPLLGRSGYAASKHALHGLFETLRTELQKTGVDVMMVCPGYTATNISFSALDGDGTITKHPQSRVGKMASPAEVADAVFLGAEKGRRIMVLTPTGVIAKYLCRIWPALYDRLMVRSLGGELER